MALVLKVFFECLHIICDYIKRLPSRRASYLALLGRKLIHFWFGNSKRPKPAEHPTLGSQASSYPVSGGSAVVKEYMVAASYVPPSAIHTNLHERTEGQPAAIAQTGVVHLPVSGSLSVDPSSTHNTTHPFGGRSNRSTGNLSALSVQSRASDRLSIITNSRDSLRASHGQPSRFPRGTHRQFGRGPDPSRSRERVAWPSTPTTRPNTPIQPPRSSLRGDSLSVSSINLPQIMDEPFALGSSIVHSSLDSPVGDLQDEPGTPTSTNPPTVDYFIPDGRFVQLINSDQIPRYEKGATMQVGYTIPS